MTVNPPPLLNYKIQGDGPYLLLIHGLFGSLDNLGLLARDLINDFSVISVDLRNHGKSFHHNEMNYQTMASDLDHLLQILKIESTIVIGHSMGGKAAMALADMAPEKVSKLIVLDMAPVAYQQSRHDNVFAGLNAVILEKPTDRKAALACLAQHVEIEGVRQFLSKSLHSKDGSMQWRFNVTDIQDNYHHIQDWKNIPAFTKPTLFLKGENSDYLIADYQTQIIAQFPNSKAHIIANTGHWLHAEKPAEVLRSIRRFLTK
ncbi:alpha/beta fold hydrolase [Vibrio rumoiensis]|uniref:Histidine kinase n=1 Tax=Vibrio rumoiensis 1S-45 TaxID=1188252 RepID=A0A1E5E0Q7_9VIBR|nr:alpha/beta fold hydrolase [Vibrio rumoiensis]OEF24020.1 histidine kinase [Vibrio rumoiensis 1S-45]